MKFLNRIKNLLKHSPSIRTPSLSTMNPQCLQDVLHCLCYIDRLGCNDFQNKSRLRDILSQARQGRDIWACAPERKSWPEASCAGAGVPRFPCRFPSEQGKRRGDAFARGCVPHHPVVLPRRHRPEPAEAGQAYPSPLADGLKGAASHQKVTGAAPRQASQRLFNTIDPKQP